MTKLVQRVERYWLPPNKTLSFYCHLSKNLFNEANYQIKYYMNKDKKWLRYSLLNWLLKDVRQSKNYKELPAQTAQQILRALDGSWSDFFKQIKDWQKYPDKYQGMPRPPKYKKKNGEHSLFFTSQQIRIKGDYIHLPEMTGIVRQMDVPRYHKVKGARIIPQGIGYIMEVIYERDAPDTITLEERLAAIDIGINNLIAMVNNIGLQPIIIKGGKVKALNQWFNKQLAKLRRIYSKTNVKFGKQQIVILLKRKRQLTDFFHKVSHYIIKWCKKHRIDKLILGYNEKWKQDINIGRRNNQNFVQIPFYRLKKMLEYKCENYGIQFEVTEESYTSKCSFLDQETIGKHKHYAGRRIKRGMFRSAQGILINADVNAAYNIMRKVNPHALNFMLTAEGIVDAGLLRRIRGLHPERVQVV